MGPLRDVTLTELVSHLEERISFIKSDLTDFLLAAQEGVDVDITTIQLLSMTLPMLRFAVDNIERLAPKLMEHGVLARPESTVAISENFSHGAAQRQWMLKHSNASGPENFFSKQQRKERMQQLCAIDTEASSAIPRL